jgi:RNA polymerase sigma-70 factor (ECF subfamily)
MASTPSSLLVRLGQPNASAHWERFVALYTPLLYTWTRRLNVPPQDAADLLQDLFTCLVEQFRSLSHDPKRSFRTWMRTLLVNRWRTWLQKRAARKVLADPKDRLEDVAVSEQVPEFEEEEYRRHVVFRALQLMQAEFQPATWNACWEYVVNGRPPEEIARELGVSVNTVYLAKSRVLRRLREELSDLLS